MYSRRVQSDVTAIGAFVYRTEHAELLQWARVPFWLIRPYEYILNIEVEEIGHLVPATDMELSSVCHPRDHQVIFTGAAMVVGTLGVAVHTSGTVDKTVGLNCDLKRLEAKPQTTKQHQQYALVVF